MVLIQTQSYPFKQFFPSLKIILTFLAVKTTAIVMQPITASIFTINKKTGQVIFLSSITFTQTWDGMFNMYHY